MNIFIELGSITALVVYIPLCIQIILGKVKQNFASWMLWSALDATAMATIIYQKGNYLLPATYTLGSFIVMLLILRSKNFSWTRVETYTSLLVLVSLAIW